MEFVQGPDRLPEKNELFEQLVSRHQVALLRFCYLYLKDREQAPASFTFALHNKNKDNRGKQHCNTNNIMCPGAVFSLKSCL